MKIKNELLKFDMANVFYAISVIYGPHRYADFCNYIKDVYDLDPSYKPVDIIDVTEEDELALNVRVYFDSEDERHISKIKLKDENNENLLTYLRKTFPMNPYEKYCDFLKNNIYNELPTIPTYNEWITFEEGCELPDEWEGVIVAAPQHKSKTMHCVYINGEFHSLGIKDQVIIPKKFMRINVSDITMKDAYTYGKKDSKE
jgi:hypothetical protein